MLPTQRDKVPNFLWFLIHFILLIVISFKVSESESLKGQNQPIRERRKPAKLNKEDFLFSLSSDDEDKGKNRPFFGLSTFCLKSLTFFSKFQNILFSANMGILSCS